MNLNTISILLVYLIGFTGVFVSILLSSGSTNRRLDDFNSNMDRQFDEIKEDVHELRQDVREIKSRLDFLVDNLAIRAYRTRIRASHKPA